MSIQKEFSQAFKNIYETYASDLLDAKRRQCISIVKLSTKMIIDTIEQESEKVISEIKKAGDDGIEEISAQFFPRMVTVIQDVLNQLETPDIDMDELEEYEDAESSESSESDRVKTKE